jgi:hypothetical protein
VTIPFRFSFRELFEMVRTHFKDGEELADVLFRLQEESFAFPFEYPRLTRDQQDRLETLFGHDLVRRIRMGSEVITEWVQRHIHQEIHLGLFSWSSPMGASFGAPSSRGFWFSVNAELIIYGATDPQASVVFDGKPVEL